MQETKVIKTTANQIQKWFDRFDSALQILLDEESIHIEYDYKKYDFKNPTKWTRTIQF